MRACRVLSLSAERQVYVDTAPERDIGMVGGTFRWDEIPASGIPVAYELVPANLDERLAAEAVIDNLASCDIFADKGFLGHERQTSIFDQTNNLIWTPKRKNQYV